jgi:integrase/recombinase XerD
MLSLAYGCGMRAGEVVRLKVGDIDSDQEIIRIVQSNAPSHKRSFAPHHHHRLLAFIQRLNSLSV